MVYAKHSIPYDSLPNYFIAFDIYDKTEKRFYSRNRLERVLYGTNIKLVPLIKYGEVKDVKELIKMVSDKSKFYDGKVEGIYARICNNKWLE